MYKVLFVDDEALIRDAIRINMKWNELGYEFAGACKNGKDAIEFLKENYVDVIITDVCMPFVDGLELSKHVHEFYPDIKVIILSGYNEFEYAKKAVKYQVLDYVLKPVTVSELSELLISVRDILTEEKKKKENISKLKGAYIKNLPILRNTYLNQIINGLHKEQYEYEIHKKLEELHYAINGDYYKIVVVMVEKAEEFLQTTPRAKKDLPSFILFNILNELLSRQENSIVFQDIHNNTIILFGYKQESEQASKINEIYNECKKIIEGSFGLGITFGLGHKVTSLTHINKSYESAASVLEYRFLYGGNRIFDICDFVKKDTIKNIDISKDIKRLLLAVKINSIEDVKTILHEMMQDLRKSQMTQSKVYVYLQIILFELGSLLESLDSTEEDTTKKQEEILQLLMKESTLEDLEKVICNYCLYIAGIMAEQRDGFDKRQAIIAKDYIDKNYDNPDLSLQTICNDLSISMSYFSSIFKKYTGETFVEALTKKRMQKAMEILTNTSLRVYEIAEKVGYNDPHYFTTIFKKYSGMTPKEFSRKGKRK
ncbi:MAG: response regulator [Thermoanaerobacteraceae bacterium]|nr:response regulator [Thermoanaerobacteraceae bacterium]